MTIRTRAWLAAALASICIAAAPTAAAQQPDAKAASQRSSEAPHAAAPPPDSVTRHTLRRGGRELDYTATAGTLPAGENPAKPIGDIFYVAYTLDGADPAARPLAFVFNGGPGAAAAYLHLGAMGPKRVAFGDDGSIPPPPGRLVANEASWLPFVDMVFVDPPGTGYSRLAPRGKDEDEDDKNVFGVRRDLRTLAAFMRLYLSRNGRWASPRFVVGESYGGFRAAALPALLERTFGMSLNGVMLISPVIEFSLQESDRYRVVPWALRLPSFAATAWHHRKVPDRGNAPAAETLDAFRREVESFALGDYVATLAASSSSEPFYARLSRYIGLDAEALQRRGGRVGAQQFAKSLLHDSRRIVSVYDGTIAVPDPHPESADFGTDPTLGPLSARVTDALASYVAGELGFKTDRAYNTLNREISRRWNWGSNGGQGFVGTAGDLKEIMTRNERFGVFVGHGMFDLVTPYLASAYVVEQMDLPERLRRNVQLEVYDGGHMMYTHARARARLARDAEAFVHRTLEGPKETGKVP